MMNLVDFLNWMYESVEHFVMFVGFMIIVGGCLRPSITIRNSPLANARKE